MSEERQLTPNEARDKLEVLMGWINHPQTLWLFEQLKLAQFNNQRRILYQIPKSDAELAEREQEIGEARGLEKAENLVESWKLTYQEIIKQEKPEDK